jgi:tetratricopeptide (TPR) repeat protein
VKLAVLYPHPGNSLPLWKGVVAGLALVLITILVIRKARKIPYIAVGWLWYVVTLIPVIGIVQVGSQAMADRYTYITLIGLFVIIAWGANDLLSKWPHRKMCLGTLAAILLPILIILTWKQVQYWENSITLFKHTLKHTSNNLIMHFHLGIALDKQDRTEEAIEHYFQALRLKPDYEEAHNNLGNAFDKQGRTKEAIEHYFQALRLKPDYAKAHYNLGNALGKQGRTEEAIEHYFQVLRIRPDYVDVHNNLAVALVRKDNIKEAIVHFREELRINPGNINVKDNLNKVLMMQQQK